MTSSFRRRRVVLGAAAVGVSAFVLYRAYRSESYRKLREALLRLHQAGGSFSAAFTAGGDISARVLVELRQFLQSDSDELPPSLRQLAKLLQSQELTQAAAAFTSAVLHGAHSRPADVASDAAAVPAPDVLERVLSALTSERGQSLVGLAVSMACRTGMHTLVEHWGSSQADSPVSGGVHLHVESLAGRIGQGLAEERAAAGGWLQTLLQWAATPEGERIVLNAVGTFVRQGTEAYMQSFGNANMWDDILAAAGKAQNTDTAQQLTRVFVNEAVASWMYPESRASLQPTPRCASPGPGQAQRSQWQQQQLEQSPPAGRHNCAAASQCSSSDRSEMHFDGSSTAAADLDSAFEEGAGACKPLPAERHREEVVLQAAAVSSAPSWTSSLLQVVQKPEARSLILAMTPVVVSECVRTGLFSTRDLIMGSNSSGVALLKSRTPVWITGIIALLVMLSLVSCLYVSSAVQVGES